MARPEPNICSQKWGNGWVGASASIVIVSAGAWASSGSEKSAKTTRNCSERNRKRIGVTKDPDLKRMGGRVGINRNCFRRRLGQQWQREKRQNNQELQRAKSQTHRCHQGSRSETDGWARRHQS